MKRSGFQRKEPPPLKKPALTRKTPLRPQSPKRIAYRRSEAGKAGLAHMARVKGLGCLVCGAPPPSEAHHVTGDKQPRNDFRVLSLCTACHKLYHARKRTWVAKHGPDYSLLPRVAAMLAEQDGSRT